LEGLRPRGGGEQLWFDREDPEDPERIEGDSECLRCVRGPPLNEGGERLKLPRDGLDDIEFLRERGWRCRNGGGDPLKLPCNDAGDKEFLGERDSERRRRPRNGGGDRLKLPRVNDGDNEFLP